MASGPLWVGKSYWAPDPSADELRRREARRPLQRELDNLDGMPINRVVDRFDKDHDACFGSVRSYPARATSAETDVDF